MIQTDLSYDQALGLPDPKHIWLDGSRVIVDDSPSADAPITVTGWQARIALHNAGLLDAINNHITNNNDARLQYKWAFAGNLERNDPDVVAVAAAIGLSDADLYSLFIEASKII